MKNRISWLISTLLLVSMLLSACAGNPVETQAPAVPTSTPFVEPTQLLEPTATVPVEASEAEIDAAYTSFLVGMRGYNALRIPAFEEMLAETPPPFILDVREVNEVTEKGYIEGAVHIPLRELGKNLDLLPSFDTPIVSYCGVGWRCTIAMTALSALGWQDVTALKDGSFGGWVNQGKPVVMGSPQAVSLNAATPDPALVMSFDKMLSSIPEGWGVIMAEKLATDLVENPNIVLIDLRKPAEVEENGYIDYDNQVNIPLEDFIKNKDQWPADKSTRIVAYCGTGHRSTIAMTILWSYGYTNVSSLKDGLSPWIEAGYPTVGAMAVDPDVALDAAYHDFLGGMVRYNTIGLNDFNILLADDQPPFILDVREINEVEGNGHIEGAVLVPLRTLAKNLDLLPSFDTPIISYCGVGWRCTIAMTALGALGWEDVRALKGGSFGGWVEEGYPVVAGLPPEAEPLNTANPDAALVSLIDKALSEIPQGWGGISADELSAELLENPDLILIDVRTLAEADENGIIDPENHLSIPLEEFISKKTEWPGDKNMKILVYCGTGHRSTMAMTILWSYGYTNVLSMKGGLEAWLASGYPVVEAVSP
jgi:rhodanese-related sulfurtransferase